jgi:hypothetical protein
MTRSPAWSDASYWPLSSAAKVGEGTKKTTGPHDHSTTAALCGCHVIDMPSTAASEEGAEDQALLAFLAAQVTRRCPSCGAGLVAPVGGIGYKARI